jgi:YVTN family beta-propeller protein
MKLSLRIAVAACAIQAMEASALAAPCAYVSGADGLTPGTGSVSVLDTGTRDIVATIPVGDNPRGLALTPDGRELYVVDGQLSSRKRGDVSVIDTTTNQVSHTVQVGRIPVSVSVSPDGRYAYVLNACGFDVTCSGLNAISVIDTTSNGTVGTIFSKENSGTYNTNCSTNGLAVSPDGLFVYAACMGSKLLIISVEEFFADTSCPQCAIVREISVQSGLRPSSVAFSSDGILAYVGARTADAAAIGVIDTESQELTATIPLPTKAYGYTGVLVVASRERAGYVTHPFLDAILPVDFATKSIGTGIPLPKSEGGRSIAFDSVNRRLIATLQDAKGLSFIDTLTNTVIPIPCVEGVCTTGLVPLPANPFGVIVATAPDCPPQFPSATPTQTSRETPPPAASVTSTATKMAIFTPTPSGAVTPTNTVLTQTTCVGDCDGNRTVSIDELVRGVAMALGLQGVDDCRAFDLNEDGLVSVDEVVRGVVAALDGCPDYPG